MINYLAKELDELVAADSKIFNFIIDNALDGTWYWDLKNPENEWMNARFWETLGYDPAKMPHKAEAWQKIIHPDDLKKTTENFLKHCENENHPCDQVVRYVHKKGHTVWIRCRGIAIRDSQGTPIRMLGAHNDITPQKQLEIKLKTKLDLHNQIIKSANIGTWSYNAQNKELILENWASIIGYEIDPSILSFRDLRKEITHPDDFEKSKKAFEDHLKGKTDSYEYEYRIKHKDGHWVWVIDRGRVLERDKKGFGISKVGMIIDITNRKKNESIIERYRNLLDDASEAILLGTWEVDLIENSLFWNPTTKKIHEVPRDFVPSLDTALNFFPKGENYDKITSHFEKALTTGEGYDLELEIITFKKNIKSVRAIGIPVFDENGKCLRIRGLFQDITHITNAKNEINTLLEISTEQNHRLTNFAHIVSHNLRSHVSNQKMLLEFMKIDHSELVGSETFKLISSAISNLDKTIGHLTEIVRINDMAKNEKKACHLNHYVTSAITSISADLKQIDGKIVNNIAEDVVVNVVPAYLESIILNFLTNAVKYRSQNRSLLMAINSYQENGYNVLSIEDNGLGIDLEKHGKKIFGMYKTFHKHKDSRGMGLFITKNQIEAMGGKVFVESEVNKGTTFKIYFRNEEN